jgi:hypothetical protein
MPPIVLRLDLARGLSCVGDFIGCGTNNVPNALSGLHGVKCDHDSQK